MGSKNQRKYTLEFKRQAVQLAQELGSSTEAATRLGISASNVHKWRTLVQTGALGGGKAGVTVNSPQAPAVSLNDEVRRLQREVAELKKVNHILKAAAAFFSQDHLK